MKYISQMVIDNQTHQLLVDIHDAVRVLTPEFAAFDPSRVIFIRVQLSKYRKWISNITPVREDIQKMLELLLRGLSRELDILQSVVHHKPISEILRNIPSFIVKINSDNWETMDDRQRIKHIYRRMCEMDTERGIIRKPDIRLFSQQIGMGGVKVGDKNIVISQNMTER